VQLFIELFLRPIAQVVTYQFDRQALTIAQRRWKSGAPGPTVVVAEVGIQLILNQAVDGDDEKL
jgi:hypothetical protein